MKYQVELSFTQHSAATVTIDADSLDQAYKLANELRPEDIEEDWRPIDGDLQVTYVAEAPAAPAAPPSTDDVVDALRRILHRFMADEAADYMETSPLENREGHIYNHLRTVARWLKHYTPA